MKSDQIAAQNVGTLLIPEAQVFRDGLVLVNSRFDLHRTIDKLLFRELKVYEFI